MAKGDQITVHFKTGDSFTMHEFNVEKSGRTIDVSLEKDSGVPWLEIHERTRGGTTTRRARYQLAEVISYREYKKAVGE